MIKSELIRRISSQNPHLYERDIEKVVNAIFDEMVEALRRGSSRTAGVRSLFS
jgi:integration host factor subunit beta